MIGKSPKPSATALNEVTVMIMSEEKENYHETFLMDTTQNNTFEFDGHTYNIPAQKAMHYKPSFWAFDRKLATFFTLHKTLGSFLDWFGFRKKANYELGFLYDEKNPNPVDLKEHMLNHDWALDNYNLRKNQSIEGHYKAVDNKLANKNPMGKFAWLAIAIIAIVAIVVVISIVSSNGGLGSNIAATVTPTPTPFPLR